MAGIATYVFLDLETTGLPSQESNLTKITELSMVALRRSHILETTAGCLPRVLNKFTMCFNTGSRWIHPNATKASGLDNFLLEHETPFNMNVFNCINNFLKCQPKPVCLIAENGFDFDFPILKNHIEKLKVSLDEDIMCADSLHGFYDILKCAFMNYAKINDESLAVESSGTKALTVQNSGTKTMIETNESPSKVNAEQTLTNDDNDLRSPLTMQQQNETTPSKSKSSKQKTKPAKHAKLKRKFFYNGDEKPKESYKLKNIYIRVLGCPGPEAHRAENDCIMTGQIATAKAAQFVEWVDENHCPFAEVVAMTPGVQI